LERGIVLIGQIVDTSLVNKRVSMKLNMDPLYGNAVSGQENGGRRLTGI
jgi:hypothetical protein